MSAKTSMPVSQLMKKKYNFITSARLMKKTAFLNKSPWHSVDRQRDNRPIANGDQPR
jgi:hypothetical protein